MFLAGLALLTYQYFSPRQHFQIKAKDFWYYIQIIFFSIYINYILRFLALRDLSSAKTSFLFSLTPFISAIYTYIFFKEKITRKQFIGLIIGFLGIIPILITMSPVEHKINKLLFFSWQECAIFLSIACNCYGWIVMRKLVHKKNYSPLMVNGITMAAGGLLALITSYFLEGPVNITHPKQFITGLIVIIIVSNIICHNLYGYLLKIYTPTFLSFAGFLMPVFTTLYSIVFLDETITWHFYLSSIIVLCGLLLFYQEELRNINIATSDAA